MKNKIDIFEIFNTNIDRNQEQQSAPDFDFFNVRELMEEKKSPENGFYGVKPGAEPEPEPVIIAEPEPEPVIIAEPEPEPVIITEPEPEPVAIAEPVLRTIPVYDEERKTAGRVSAKRLVIKAISFGIIVALLSVLIGIPRVYMNSMDPIISDGDRVVISKRIKQLKKNDVVMFKDNNGKKITARIVAVRGDVVNINNKGGLYINNELQVEEDIHTVTAITDVAVAYPVIVQEGTYFVLGDNRSDSVDSRNSEVGLLEAKDVMGKVIFCFKKVK